MIFTWAIDLYMLSLTTYNFYINDTDLIRPLSFYRRIGSSSIEANRVETGYLFNRQAC